MKKLNLTIDGEEVEVLAQKMAGKVWLHYKGQTFAYTPKQNQKQGPAGGANQDPSQIVAPMPGKIIKIFVAEGDSVAEGETVVAMEAMKMEYNLKAMQNMKVKSIKCSEGAQVGLSDLLVELEEEDA